MFDFILATQLPVIEIEGVVEETTSAATTTGSDNTLLFVIIIAAIVAVIAIVVTIILICVLTKQKKAKKKQNNVVYVQEQRPMAQPVIRNEKRVETQKISGQSGHTQHLWGTGRDGDKQIFLYLKDDYDNSRSFRAPIDSQVVIGRKEGDIIISEDSSLSKRHCRFIRRGNIYYIEDLNSSNGTRYNGQLIQGETPIMPGGVIEIGRQRLRMEVKEVTR